MSLERIEKIKEIFLNIDCIALFHNGSRVAGCATEKSDTDLVCIVKNKSDIDKIHSQLLLHFSLHDYGDDDNGKYICISYFYQGHEIDISFFEENMIEKHVANFFDSPENVIMDQSWVKHKVVDAETLYDPEGLLQKYQDFLNYDKEMQIKVCEISIKEAYFYINFWERCGLKNDFQWNFEKRDAIKAICEARYASQGAFFMLGYKRLHLDGPTFSNSIYTKLQAIISGVSYENAQTYIEIMKEIIDEIQRKIE